MPDKILVADDEEKIARMVGSYLEASGFQPLLAFDGATALSLFKEQAPACLILDINMPGADGLEVARQARKTSSVPIIFLTARADETDRIPASSSAPTTISPSPSARASSSRAYAPS